MQLSNIIAYSYILRQHEKQAKKKKKNLDSTWTPMHIPVHNITYYLSSQQFAIIGSNSHRSLVITREIGP
jgi:hypothetical protein